MVKLRPKLKKLCIFSTVVGDLLESEVLMYEKETVRYGVSYLVDSPKISLKKPHLFGRYGVSYLVLLQRDFW